MIAPALSHTQQQLLKPFRLGQWTRLALVGLLAGELGSGGCNFRQGLQAGKPHIDPAILGGLIAILLVAGLVLGLLLMYIGSVMRFILFDSVLMKECHIRQGWRRRQDAGLKYFWFKLAYGLASFFVFVVLIGVPAAIAFALGWFKAPREHLAPLILGGILLVLLIVLLAIFSGVILVLTKDFVVPQMALEGIGAVEAWRRLWRMLQAERGEYFVYIVIKIVLAIVALIMVFIATLILGLFIAVPAILVGVVAAVGGQSAGLTWNAYTITLAIVVGSIVFAGFFYLVSLLSVPVTVFFPAYSIYFFAARYPALAQALYPAPPAPVPPVFSPPPEPPPLPPAPSPV